jgi:hypothetical protein
MRMAVLSAIGMPTKFSNLPDEAISSQARWEFIPTHQLIAAQALLLIYYEITAAFLTGMIPNLKQCG